MDGCAKASYAFVVYLIYDDRAEFLIHVFNIYEAGQVNYGSYIG